MANDFNMLCDRMIEGQLKPRGIRSEAVLRAMRCVPRHIFVPKHLHSSAYDDSPLSIGLGQTISQPYIVAYMTEQLKPVPGMKILEIGTGSGYQTAILAYLGCEVYSIECLEELIAGAQTALDSLNCQNVYIKHGNGYTGWPEQAPFDAIIVTAAPETIPVQLTEQLKPAGTMIVPVGPAYSVQSLKIITKKDAGFIEKELCQVRFVPMVDTKA